MFLPTYVTLTKTLEVLIPLTSVTTTSTTLQKRSLLNTDNSLVLIDTVMSIRFCPV